MAKFRSFVRYSLYLGLYLNDHQEYLSENPHKQNIFISMVISQDINPCPKIFIIFGRRLNVSGGQF